MRGVRPCSDPGRDVSCYIASWLEEAGCPQHAPLDTEQGHSLNVLQAPALALLRIIGDILDFSKIEAGRLEKDPVAISLPERLCSAVANHAGSASSKDLSLECRLDPSVGQAHLAGPVRLRQMVGNFLSNAINFADSGRVVDVLEIASSDPHDGPHGSDELVFRVTDTGIGVSPRRLPTTIAAEDGRSLVLLVDDHPTNCQMIQRQLAYPPRLDATILAELNGGDPSDARDLLGKFLDSTRDDIAQPNACGWTWRSATRREPTATQRACTLGPGKPKECSDEDMAGGMFQGRRGQDHDRDPSGCRSGGGRA